MTFRRGRLCPDGGRYDKEKDSGETGGEAVIGGAGGGIGGVAGWECAAVTDIEEAEMHALAERLVMLTRERPWEAMKYAAIGATMEQLAAYCAVCDCQKAAKRP